MQSTESFRNLDPKNHWDNNWQLLCQDLLKHRLTGRVICFRNVDGVGALFYVIARLCSSSRWISSAASSSRSPTLLVQFSGSFFATARSIRRQALITVL